MKRVLEMIWEALVHTPWWVYLLFFYLLKVGFDATKTRVVSQKKLLILPIVFLALSLSTLLNSLHSTTPILLLYLLSLSFGTGGGWLLVRNTNLQFDQKKKLVKVPGSWTPLILIMTIFGTKYALRYSLAVDPALADNRNFAILILGISGLCTGLLIGRVSCFLLRKHKASHIEL